MPNQLASIDFNNFVGGRNSDAGPLNFPPNASLDEDNFVLNKDGSRQRRLGMDYEENYAENDASIGKIFDTTPGMVFNTFRWDGVGGVAGKSFLVVQCGTLIDIYDLDIEPLSSGKLFSLSGLFGYTHSGYDSFDNFGVMFSFAVIEGMLVIATKNRDITKVIYDIPTDTLSSSTFRLRIRDHFGLAVTKDSVNLRIGDGVTKRFESSGGDWAEIVYNLRNQSWAATRPQANDEDLGDPIKFFVDTFATVNGVPALVKFPSHADTVNGSLYADTEDTDDRTLRRFFATDLIKNPRGTAHAGTGHFIIDALDRGEARHASVIAAKDEYPDTYYLPWGIIGDSIINVFPEDITPTGASVIGTFAGRVFYGGFSGVTIDGDNKTPSMESLILFTQLVTSEDELGLCYQQADPTNLDDPNIVATDGGFINVSGALGMHTYENVGNSLMVIAENGVWRILGGTESGFSATGYIVEKISEIGCKSSGSVVVVDNTILYWAVDGIRHIKPTENGTYISENITQGRLQNFYNEIPEEDIVCTAGVYDSFQNKVRWVYGTRVEEDGTDTRELVLDLNLSAYYTNTITKVNDSKLVSIFKDNPFKQEELLSDVVTGSGDLVVDGSGNQVVVSNNVRRTGTKEVGYVVVTEDFPDIKYTFALYRDDEFIDWKSEDTVGVDAAAYLITGYTTGEELQRNKKIENLVFKLRRTETGFIADGDDLTPINPSSCIVQAQWGWTDNIAAGRWSREFQAYKYKRHYLASGIADPYETGDLLIETKHRPRGKGKAISLYMRSEPLKDLHLYGWSVLLSVSSDV